MTRGVEVAVSGVRIPLGRARVAAIVDAVLGAEGVRHALVSVSFVTTARIAALNRRHLGHGGATDVISFGFVRRRAADPVIADIYIAAAVARANAAAHGATLREELTRLVVHGTLHALGYDHPTDAGRTTSAMWRRQEALVRRLQRRAPRKAAARRASAA